MSLGHIEGPSAATGHQTKASHGGGIRPVVEWTARAAGRTSDAPPSSAARHYMERLSMKAVARDEVWQRTEVHDRRGALVYSGGEFIFDVRSRAV